LGGKKLPWWALSLSIVATETSTLTFIGAPAIAFTGNLTFLQLALGYLIGKILVAFILIPGYFKGDIQTAYQILRHRFGPRVRDLSALLFQVSRSLADGVRLFATALVLSVVTDISDVWTVVLIGVVTVLYTYYGGMKAVAWNDVIQLLVYVGGGILTFFVILRRIPDGWRGVMTYTGVEQKLQVVDLSIDCTEPYTLLAGLIGGAFLTFATHGTDQMMVQRYLACGSEEKSKIALIVSGVIVFFQFLLFLFIGFLLYIFYQHFPLQHELEQVNRILPIFIMEELPPGLSGLIIAAIFAAAMSTLSSSLNSLSSSTVNDVYKEYLVPNAGEEHYLKVSRLMTLIWAFILIFVALLAKNWGELLQAGLTITGFTMGSVLGVFLLGTLTKNARERDGFISMVLGLTVMVIVGLASPLAWTWYVLVGTATTFFSGLLFSRISCKRQL
jgi:SSS family transporter